MNSWLLKYIILKNKIKNNAKMAKFFWVEFFFFRPLNLNRTRRREIYHRIVEIANFFWVVSFFFKPLNLNLTRGREIYHHIIKYFGVVGATYSRKISASDFTRSLPMSFYISLLLVDNPLFYNLWIKVKNYYNCKWKKKLSCDHSSWVSNFKWIIYIYILYI